MDSEMHLVFVYGTLRKGASNAFRMEGAEWVGQGRVDGALYFIDWYPGLVLDEESNSVVGDVFRVASDLLQRLDEYEGVATEEFEEAEYRRVKTRVEMDAGEARDAWVWEWLGPRPEECRIACGDWLERD